MDCMVGIPSRSIYGWSLNSMIKLKASSFCGMNHLGGGFEHVLFSSLLGEDSHFD